MGIVVYWENYGTKISECIFNTAILNILLKLFIKKKKSTKRPQWKSLEARSWRDDDSRTQKEGERLLFFPGKDSVNENPGLFPYCSPHSFFSFYEIAPLPLLCRDSHVAHHDCSPYWNSQLIHTHTHTHTNLSCRVVWQSNCFQSTFRWPIQRPWLLRR